MPENHHRLENCGRILPRLRGSRAGPRGVGMDKTIASLREAVSGIEDGMTVMIGGFGGSGAPIELIHALIDRFVQTGHPTNLTVVNNNAGNGHVGLAALIEQGM